jgi:WD40 repeat protein
MRVTRAHPTRPMHALHSTTLSSQAYVLSLASINTSYAASASSPSNLIDLFDKSTLQLVQTLPGHDSATTSLRTVQSIAGSTRQSLTSCGKDGTVKAWDERSNAVSVKREHPDLCIYIWKTQPSSLVTTSGRPRPLLCFDASLDGFIVAAGTDLQSDDALILYW